MNRAFPLGQLAATPGAIEAATMVRINECLARHAAGDWGELDEEDRQANEVALANRQRLLSVYRINDAQPCEGDNRLWIITEGDRSVTTVLLPDEY